MSKMLAVVFSLVLMVSSWSGVANAATNPTVTIDLRLDADGNATSLTVTPAKVSVKPGQKIDVVLTANGQLRRAVAITLGAAAAELTFPSTVTITAPATPGTYTLTVTYRGKTASSSVIVDNKAPRCSPPIKSTVNLRTMITIAIQDEESGLESITITEALNADVQGAGSFVVGTTSQVFVTATKVDENSVARLSLTARDLAGNVAFCDPILTGVARAAGQPIRETYSGIPENEHAVTIFNGNPGLTNLEIIVNGMKFRLNGLGAGQERTLDVSAAMIPGDKNIFVLKATGKPGGDAMVMIWDGPH